MMDGETPMEKLLQASGVQQRTQGQGQETTGELMRRLDTLMGQLESDRAEVKRTQDQCVKLMRYCEQILPRKMFESVEGVVREGVSESLRPFNPAVARAIDDIERCRHGLGRIVWYWLRDVALAGLVMGLVGGFMVRWAFVREVEEAKRYEVWGRKIEQRVLDLPPQRREHFFRWAGGRP